MSSAAPDRGDRRRARDAADERHLADVLARAEVVSVCSPRDDADLALEHDEELVALVALADDDVAVLVVADLDGLHHAEQLALGEPREERHVREHVALEREALARARRRPRPLRRPARRRSVMLSLPPRSLASSMSALTPSSPSSASGARELLGRLEVAVQAVAREDELSPAMSSMTSVSTSTRS